MLSSAYVRQRSGVTRYVSSVASVLTYPRIFGRLDVLSCELEGRIDREFFRLLCPDATEELVRREITKSLQSLRRDLQPPLQDRARACANAPMTASSLSNSGKAKPPGAAGP